MIFKPVFEPYLAQNSYVVGCAETKEAIVIDPTRFVDRYIETAAAEGLTITAVTETHIHEDFLSGARALARKAGATLHLSGEGGLYSLASHRHVRVMHGGDRIPVGRLRLEAQHTPAHAPEHLSFIVFDAPAPAVAVGAFTGDDPASATAGYPLWPAHTDAPSSWEPDEPRHFPEMQRKNRRGEADAAATHRRLPAVGPGELQRLLISFALIVDVRPGAAATGFLPGSMVLPLNQFFVVRAGGLLRFGMPLHLVAACESDAAAARDALSLIGIDDIRGWIAPSAVAAYHAGGGVLEYLRDATVPEALRLSVEGHLILDVRSSQEWRAGHIANALHTPLAHLVDDVCRVDRSTPLVVYSQSGERAAIAASALHRIGFSSVANLKGGFSSYRPYTLTRATSESG